MNLFFILVHTAVFVFSKPRFQGLPWTTKSQMPKSHIKWHMVFTNLCLSYLQWWALILSTRHNLELSGARISLKYCWHWVDMWDIVVIHKSNWYRKPSHHGEHLSQERVSWTVLKVDLFSWTQEARELKHINFSLLLITNGMWLASLSFCHLNLSATIDDKLKLWCKTNPLWPNYFVSGIAFWSQQYIWN